MLRYVLTRLGLAVPTLLAISFLVFFAAYLSPADPVDIILGQRAAPEAKARVRHEWGLDRPPLERYGKYVVAVVTKGDFGRSYQTKEPVTEFIARGFPNTAMLAVSALGLALLTGIPLGVVAAIKHNSWIDRFAMAFALLGVATPSFVLAPVLTLVLAVRMGWLPVGGFSLQEGIVDPATFILPTVVLAARSSALIARLTRSAMLDVLSQDFIRTARAKGVRPLGVLFKHALRNALSPILTVAGTTFGYLLSGSFVVETFFTIPGIGNQSITAITARDYPVIQGLALLLAGIFVGVNLIVDILQGFVDPRARVSDQKAI